MNATLSAQHDSALAARSENRDAKRWIDKQWARVAERHNKTQFDALNGGQ